MLSPDEIKRRIDAARTLRGMTQAELGELLHADGLGKHDVGRIERGTMKLQRVHREALCRHLRVPPTWFVDADLDRVLDYASHERVVERLERIEEALSLLSGLGPAEVLEAEADRLDAQRPHIAESSPRTGESDSAS